MSHIATIISQITWAAEDTKNHRYSFAYSEWLNLPDFLGLFRFDQNPCPFHPSVCVSSHFLIRPVHLSSPPSSLYHLLCLPQAVFTLSCSCRALILDPYRSLSRTHTHTRTNPTCLTLPCTIPNHYLNGLYHCDSVASAFVLRSLDEINLY